MTPAEIVFDKLAFTTWEAIGNAFKNRISYGEDAIISINLLTLTHKTGTDPSNKLLSFCLAEHFAPGEAEHCCKENNGTEK